MFGPRNLPPDLAMRLRDDVVAVLAEAETAAKIRDLSSLGGGETPQSFATRISKELQEWRDVAKLAGVEPE
jgi:tripartite-type tricarboxylate transporter receptor subunit TctC